MLIDLKFNPMDPQLDMIINLIADPEKPKLKRLDTGLYQIQHFSGDLILNGYNVNPIPKLADCEEHYINCYGVCDSPTQLVEKIPQLTTSGKRYIIFFTEIVKADQGPNGGWRWHKWGPYIGDHEPTCEYLWDEPIIQNVFVYHIYEVL